MGEDVGVTMPSHTHNTGAVFPLKQLLNELPMKDVGEFVTLCVAPPMAPYAKLAAVHAPQLLVESLPAYVPPFPHPIQNDPAEPVYPTDSATVFSRLPRVLMK